MKSIATIARPRITFGEKCAHGEGYSCAMCADKGKFVPFADYSEPTFTTDGYDVWSATSYLFRSNVSEIAFHASTGNRIIRPVPSEPLYRDSYGSLAYMLSRHDKEPQIVAPDPDPLRSQSWEEWSVAIDLELFGHETSFSRIPYPLKNE